MSPKSDNSNQGWLKGMLCTTKYGNKNIYKLYMFEYTSSRIR